jgi:hypothetical protein
VELSRTEMFHLPSTSHHCITSSFVKLAKGKKLVHNRQDLFLVFPVFDLRIINASTFLLATYETQL